MNFVCVLKSGGIYNPEHVRRLQEQLDRPLSCLTDLDFKLPQVTTWKLKHNWKGWWSKIELFRLECPVTYLDLDVTVVGNPDKLHRDKFTMWEDPLYPQGFNSSVMSWSETPKNVYETFLRNPKEPERRYRRWPKAGDQGFIQDHAGDIQKFEDGLILSYKAHVKKDKDTKDAVLIAYHGKPKPWDLQANESNSK